MGALRPRGNSRRRFTTAFDDRSWLILRRWILRATLPLLRSLALCAALSNNTRALEVGPSGDTDFGGLQFKILSSDGRQTIGYTRFTVLKNNSIEEIKGETRYLDGERDSEDEFLYLAPPTYIPRLDSYEHSFFNADGTLKMVDTLSVKSGVASCMSHMSGRVNVRKSLLDVPADSFAGASGLMMIVGSLRHGNREISFHAFACAPGPELFAVEASLPERSERWPLYPGDLFRLDMRPDLGALNLLIAPFLPTMDAWFNPNDNWNYVGGEFDRYFRGPHVMTVRMPPAE